MNQRNINFIQVIRCFIATFVIAFCVSLFVACELGSDTVTIFLDGMNRSFHISVGMMDQLLTIGMFLLAYVLNRKAIGINSIINTLCIGTSIAIAQTMIAPLQLSEQAVWIRWIAIIIAQIGIAFSYALMQTFPTGMSITDILLYHGMHTFHKSYVTIRLVYDVTFVVLGVCLHGIIGLGTVFSLLTMGMFTSFFKQRIMNLQQHNLQQPNLTV